MIRGVGIDIVHLNNVQAMVDSRTSESLHDIFTDSEIVLCQSSLNPTERFAARFAAKEAAMKALGLGWQEDGLDWTDIEVSIDVNGRPELNLVGKARDRAQELGVTANWISMSHEETLAIAIVVLES